MKKLSFIILYLLTSIGIYAQSAHSYLRSGDADYGTQNYENAEINYRKALEVEKSTKGNYNLGNTIYNQERFEEAIRHYEAAANKAQDQATKSKAYHNLGNAYFGQQQFDKSVNAFKNALRLNPKDLETKFNLSKAQQQLRIQQQQKQQQQQSQDQQEQEQEQQQQDQQQQQSQDQEQQPVNNEEDQQQSQPQPKDLTKEEAQQLLDIMDEEERKVQEKLKRAKGKKSKSSKDW